MLLFVLAKSLVIPIWCYPNYVVNMFPFFSHVCLFILLCRSTVKSINTSCLKSSFAIYRLLMKDTSNGLFTPLRKKTISHLVTLVNSQLSNMILLIFPCIFAWFYPKMSACCSLRNLGYF